MTNPDINHDPLKAQALRELERLGYSIQGDLLFPPDTEAVTRKLEKAEDSIRGFVAQVQMLEQQVRELSAFKAMVNRHKPEFPADPDGPRDVWYWQGDGEDHLESMTHQLPVVIRAEQLRELIDEAKVAPAVTDEMVSRFLGWRLPDSFSPDCGISFDGRKDDEWNKNKTWPIGTNLFNADEARAMLEHVLGDAAPAQPKRWSIHEQNPAALAERIGEYLSKQGNVGAQEYHMLLVAARATLAAGIKPQLAGWRFERIDDHTIRISDPLAPHPLLIDLRMQDARWRIVWRLAVAMIEA